MKFRLLIIAVFGILLFNGCNKASVNPIFDGTYKVGAYLTLKSTDNINFNFADLTKFVGITVGQHGTHIAKVNLFVVDDGSSKTAWTLVKTFPFTGDSIQLHVTGNEVATALKYTSTDFQPGSTLTFYNQVVTDDGSTYDINNGGPNVTAPDLNSVFTWTAYIVCPFTGGIAGKYTVVQDGWNDWSAGATVQVTDGPGANQINLSQVYPNPAYGSSVNPLVVDIDPSNGAATIKPGDVDHPWGDYGYNAWTGDGSSGYVFSCTGYIGLTIHIVTDAYGDQGNVKLVLQRQ